MIFGFSQQDYIFPEEDSEGNGYVFDVCVELFSGELDREVVITVTDENGNAIGEWGLVA